MTVGQTIALLAVLVTVLGYFARELHAARIERKRTQPIVIAHYKRPPRFDRDRRAWLADAYLTNDGGGTAFNLRFGVEWGGVRYAFRLNPADPRTGNVQRVVRVGDGPRASILITSGEMWGHSARPRPGSAMNEARMYWARYENAYGATWETRNPADRSARLDIRRVRLLRLREWREDRRREKAARLTAEVEAAILADLRSGGVSGGSLDLTTPSKNEPPAE
jgi:hypothetical protein